MGKAGPETRLVQRIVEAIRREYPRAWVQKIHGGPYQTAGIPDLFVVIAGRLLALEVKARRPGESRQALMERVTPRQRVQIQRLRRAGARAYVIDSVEQALIACRKTKYKSRLDKSRL